MKVPVLASHLFSYCDLDPYHQIGAGFWQQHAGSTSASSFASLPVSVAWLHVRRLRGFLLVLHVWHGQFSHGQWGSGMCSWQRADKPSSAAVEIRDRQVVTRGWNRSFGLLQATSRSGFHCSLLQENLAKPYNCGNRFFGVYFLVVCFPWLLLLDQYRQKCNTMCFWHQSNVK